MSDVSSLECPNCGSTDFDQIALNKQRCAYCGTVLMTREETGDQVRCLRCGSRNDLEASYCRNCGAALVAWSPVRRAKADPALVSIIVTVAGSFVVPIAGAVVGLILGYKALREARAGETQRGSEKLARTAVIVGWVFVVFGVVPLCMVVVMPGVQLGVSACEELAQMLMEAVR